MQEKAEENIKIPIEPSFVGFINLLATISLQHLGMEKNAVTGKIEKNYQLAKYIIDSLNILEEKTKNNLTDDEIQFIRKVNSELEAFYSYRLAKA
ncbi:MAG: DUF1844 domain-containing protein [Spirochaetales bacterium]|nr:DUF1844 domain-containing protein [Spirochaetales bacterium]